MQLVADPVTIDVVLPRCLAPVTTSARPANTAPSTPLATTNILFIADGAYRGADRTSTYYNAVDR